jgi:hypothetical protein
MRVGSILTEAIGAIERKLQAALNEKASTITFIGQAQESLKKIDKEIEGYHRALDVLNEEANKI